MRVFSILTVVVLILLFIFSCKREKGSGELNKCVTEGVTFKDHVAPLLETKCNASGCHAEGSTFGDFTTYEEVFVLAANGEIAEEVLEEMTMPIGSTLDASELEIFRCWLENGYLNDGIGDTSTVQDTVTNDSTSQEPEPSSLCDTVIPTYVFTVKRIFDAACAISGCHMAGAGIGDYTKYSTIGADKDSLGKIWNRVVNLKNMPPTYNAITQAERDSIECWINNGAPEN